MMVIRPMVGTDFEALCQIAEASGPGFTSLTTDRDLLTDKIEKAQHAFAVQLDNGPVDEHYLFSLEDTETGKVIGCCGLESAVGMSEPFYNYRVGMNVHASRGLDIYRQMPTLYLSNDYTGASAMCTLFLHPESRRSGAGKLLSKSRFLFMAEHLERFADRVIAEMRGWSDEDGQSPFWDALGRQFFNMDYAQADHLSAVHTKSFIAELMPRHPVYTCLLPEAAQKTIGAVHPTTEPARRLLEAEGFRYTGYIDIFDGGAAVDCLINDIRAIKFSRRAAAKLAAGTDSGVRALVSNTGLDDFRCVITTVDVPEVPSHSADAADTADPAITTATIPAAAAQALNIKNGDAIRYLAL